MEKFTKDEILKMSREVQVIGCGGIGGSLLLHLSKLMIDHASRITLFDGDKFDSSNHNRQFFMGDGYKAQAWANFLRNSPGLNVKATCNNLYVGHGVNLRAIKSVIFICVDNHETRKSIERWVSEYLSQAIVISGGNDSTDGNVQMYGFRFNSQANSGMNGGEYPHGERLTTRHPEIADKIDFEASKEKAGCDEIPQTYMANATAAGIMASIYNNLKEGVMPEADEWFFDTKTQVIRPNVSPIKHIELTKPTDA